MKVCPTLSLPSTHRWCNIKIRCKQVHMHVSYKLFKTMEKKITHRDFNGLMVVEGQYERGDGLSLSLSNSLSSSGFFFGNCEIVLFI